MNFGERPALVFWETTRACSLACVHCRASAITAPLQGELSGEEGNQLIDQVASFGKPYPTLVFTGGDPLERRDLFELMSHARNAGVRFAVSPAATTLLNDKTLEKFAKLETASVSISLDGACARTHDSIRKVEGTFERTIDRISRAVQTGLYVQVNTAVMKSNFRELPQIFHLVRNLGVKTWELFFLVKVGRGTAVEDLSQEECESVAHFLYDTSRHGMTIRCVEAPFIRRIVSRKSSDRTCCEDEDYFGLRQELTRLEGEPSGASSLRLRGTLDGDGVVFVSYDGSIYPGGLLPIRIGNAREDSLVRVYRENRLLRSIRERKLNGPCGICNYREICGGSRARSYACYDDPLGSDPACILTTQTR